MRNTTMARGLSRFAAGMGIALFILASASCLDVVQTIETQGNTTTTQLKITFSKALIEGGAAMSGEEPDYSDLPDFTGEDGLVQTVIPGGKVEVVQVNNDSDIGVLVNASYTAGNLTSLSAEDRAFFPLVEAKRIEILLPPNDDAGEMDEMAAMFFGSSKYRMLIQKSAGRHSISRILIDGEPADLPVLEMEDVLLIELPLLTWLAARDVLPVEIFFD